MSCGIYKIENQINHKVYIGQSKNIEARWRKHRSPEDDYSIHQAIRRYGVNNFDFKIIEECAPELLDERERYWIEHYNSYKKGYNETFGGQGSSGHSEKLTLEQVEEITRLLSTNQVSNIELAEKFQVSENTISGINTGYYWNRSNIDYPIARERARKKEQKYCIDCGGPIFRSSTRCTKCSSIARRVTKRPSKEELYSLLKENGGNFTLLGKRFNVSDNTVRKWCQAYGIPHKSSDYKPKKEVKEKQETVSFMVEQIDKKTNQTIATFSSIKEAEKATGIYHISEASDDKNTSRKTAGGYIWKRVGVTILNP